MNSQFKQMKQELKQELKQVLKRELKHYFDGYSSDSSHSELAESEMNGSDSDCGLFTEDNPYSGFYKTSLETGIFVVKCQNVEAFKLAVEQIEINLKELGKKQETDLKLKQKDLQISNLQEEVASLKDALDEKQEELNEWSNYFEETDLKLKQKDLQISNLQEKVASQRSDVFISYEQDLRIAKLQAKVTSLENAQKVTKKENWIKALQISKFQEKKTLMERQEEYWTKASNYRWLNDIKEDRKAIDLEEAIMLTLWDEIEDQELPAEKTYAKMYAALEEMQLYANGKIKCKTCGHRLLPKELGISVSLSVEKFAKPLHCKSCWKKFIRNRDWHVRKDTGGKLFKCKPCKKALWRR